MTVRLLSPAAALGASLALLAGCAQYGSQGPGASSTLQPRSGSAVSGSARFTQSGGQVLAHVEVSGLTPGQEHGLHIHDKGDCSAPDAMSAGGHFNPTGKPHGPQDGEHHGGDLPALKADANGRAVADFSVAGVTVAPGPTSIVGRSLVVHKDPDDYKTQPTGNSGARVACGVITAP
ncbi:MAG: superoxide dismutase family protein [Proteobacteria bacterium]|nr:superoxide dismutase family protein [Pseudomonadota bacterium]